MSDTGDVVLRSVWRLAFYLVSDAFFGLILDTWPLFLCHVTELCWYAMLPNIYGEVGLSSVEGWFLKICPTSQVSTQPGHPLLVGAMSTGESWYVNRHTVSMVLHCKLVSGWGLRKWRSSPRCGPHDRGRSLCFSLCATRTACTHQWVVFSVVAYSVLSMQEPNPEDPLNKEAAELLQTNRRMFEQNVAKALRGGYIGSMYFERCLKW